MQPNDIIRVNVTGTNGSTRKQSTISEVFNGLGLPLTSDGKTADGKPDRLRNLPGDGQKALPEFPQADFAAALAANDVAKVKQIQIAYAEQIQAHEAKQGGGNESLQIAKSVLEYAKEFHGFREEDGDWFVMKLENLDVVKSTLPDKRSMYTVTGTAVFGA